MLLAHDAVRALSVDPADITSTAWLSAKHSTLVRRHVSDRVCALNAEPTCSAGLYS